MNLHSLTNTPGARKGRMRVGRGRGSGRGKTAGRGQKGQMSRKGHKVKDGFEGGQMKLIRRLPKRGFKNPVRRELAVVNVGDLARFAADTEVTQALLQACGLVKDLKDGIKILGDGELAARLVVKVCAFSASAKAKIEAAGGNCEVVTD